MKLDDDWIQEFLASDGARAIETARASVAEDVLVHPAVDAREVPSGIEGKSLRDILVDEYLDLDDEVLGDLELTKPQVSHGLVISS